jgi:Pentapeptide repeats (8 copies)
MGAKPRSCRHLITILVVLIILAVVILLIIIGYRFDWTGFNGNNKSGKKLWDWLQLIFIPAVLTLGAIWYTARQSHDREIMLDNQRETALQTYIDKIPVYKLAEPELAGTKEQIILRARTLALLPSMDANRKRTLLQFLYELHLICIPDRVHPKYPIIKLSTADLSGANLTNLNLEEADLAQSNLSRANLRGAILTKANLQGAILDNADLSQANLRDATGIDTRELERKAKLLQGAIMPDGTKHD